MKLTLTTPAARPEPHTLCHLDWRNNNGSKEPTHLIRVRHFETEAQLDAAKQAAKGYSAPAFKGLSSAHAHLKGLLEGRRERLLAELAQVEYNLRELPELYAQPQPLAEHLAEHHWELLEKFRQLKAQQGSFKSGPLGVSNAYMDAGPTLFVFTLPEYDPVIQTFSSQACEQILQLMTKAGLEVVDQWNGLGLTTWSIRVSPQCVQDTKKAA